MIKSCTTCIRYDVSRKHIGIKGIMYRCYWTHQWCYPDKDVENCGYYRAGIPYGNKPDTPWVQPIIGN